MALSILNKKTTIKCLISAGPTREWIDPVRFISNPSSGKMGYALASVAKKLNMSVTLVSGPVNLPSPEGVELIKVDSAIQMQSAMNENYESADLIIMTAAVSDHRPSVRYDRKLHKQELPEKIQLTPNPDILNELGLKKKQNQLLVGFAAETNDILESARKKLHDKNLDWIVVNDVSKSETGFASDKNEVIVLSSDGSEKMLSSDYKSNIAEKLINIFSSSCLEKAL